MSNGNQADTFAKLVNRNDGDVDGVLVTDWTGNPEGDDEILPEGTVVRVIGKAADLWPDACDYGLDEYVIECDGKLYTVFPERFELVGDASEQEQSR